MLAPHHREDAELGQVRLAPENGDGAGVLLGCQAVLGDDVGGDGDGAALVKSPLPTGERPFDASGGPSAQKWEGGGYAGERWRPLHPSPSRRAGPPEESKGLSRKGRRECCLALT